MEGLSRYIKRDVCSTPPSEYPPDVRSALMARSKGVEVSQLPDLSKLSAVEQLAALFNLRVLDLPLPLDRTIEIHVDSLLNDTEEDTVQMANILPGLPSEYLDDTLEVVLDQIERAFKSKQPGLETLNAKTATLKAYLFLNLLLMIYPFPKALRAYKPFFDQLIARFTDKNPIATTKLTQADLEGFRLDMRNTLFSHWFPEITPEIMAAFMAKFAHNIFPDFPTFGVPSPTKIATSRDVKDFFKTQTATAVPVTIEPTVEQTRILKTLHLLYGLNTKDDYLAQLFIAMNKIEEQLVRDILPLIEQMQKDGVDLTPENLDRYYERKFTNGSTKKLSDHPGYHFALVLLRAYRVLFGGSGGT